MSTEPDAISALAARYRAATQALPGGSSDDVVELMMRGLSRDQILTLASDWLGMGASGGTDAEATARGFVQNFVLELTDAEDE